MARMQTTNGPSHLPAQVAGRDADSFFQIEAWMPSEIKAISPLVDRLMRLIEGSHCVCGEEPSVELALVEALNNAVVHGNRMDRKKLVQILCRCELVKGVSIVVKDQGQGFDANAVPDPTAPENIGAEHGRGIWLMKTVMDEVCFERGGTEVRMRKSDTPARSGVRGANEIFPSARQIASGTAPPLSASEQVDSPNKRG